MKNVMTYPGTQWKIEGDELCLHLRNRSIVSQSQGSFSLQINMILMFHNSVWFTNFCVPGEKLLPKLLFYINPSTLQTGESHKIART